MGSPLDNYTGGMYTIKFLEPKTRAKHIRAAIKVLKPIAHTFDSVAFCGMSGALIAPEIAKKLNKELIMVRKSNKGHHSNYMVEGYYRSNKYIIVDDFIDSGKTVKRMKKCIDQALNSYTKCLGVLSVQELKGVSGYNRTGLIPIPN